MDLLEDRKEKAEGSAYAWRIGLRRLPFSYSVLYRTYEVSASVYFALLMIVSRNVVWLGWMSVCRVVPDEFRTRTTHIGSGGSSSGTTTTGNHTHRIRLRRPT